MLREPFDQPFARRKLEKLRFPAAHFQYALEGILEQEPRVCNVVADSYTQHGHRLPVKISALILAQSPPVAKPNLTAQVPNLTSRAGSAPKMTTLRPIVTAPPAVGEGSWYTEHKKNDHKGGNDHVDR